MTSAVLIGSPNSGKSLLFNRLTGLNQKVANFPGITVDVTEGHLVGDENIRIFDFPGTYSLHPISGEERIAVAGFQRMLEAADTSAVLCIVDATRLAKSLHFALQVVRACQLRGKRVVLLANMVDVLERHDFRFDAEGLSQALDIPVIALSGRTGRGMDEVEAVVRDLRAHDAQAVASGGLHDADDEQLAKLAVDLHRRFGMDGEVLVRNQTRIDAFFLHSTFGGVAFAGLMYLLFQSIFTWAAPVMDAVEGGVGALASVVVPLLPAGVVADFVADALFGGIGAFLVFVPQIFVLTLVVGIMEDSGYLARAAVICHRPLRIFGLNGKSFVPMLSGVACAIPAIYAARAIDSPRRRFLTYLAIPLMPCSARLPVYTLLIAAFIPAHTALGGLVGLQGLALFGLYGFGLVVGLLSSALVARFSDQDQDDLPFILEMPPYRLPSWRPLLRLCWDRSRHFVTKAGAVILSVTVAVWVLGYFPNGGEDLGASWLGRVGHVIEPLFAPLGLDWRYAVAILSAFLAREVFVGTLGTLFGIEGAEEDFLPLAEQIAASGLTIASGFAILAFFAIALQCVSTVAVLRGETGSWRLPAQLLVAYGVLAYALAWITYVTVGWIVA